MSSDRRGNLLFKLRRDALARGEVAADDAQLVEAFQRDRDAFALEALIRRHGPMVFGVARRVLRDHNDAEDAYQATFLVFVSKATSLCQPHLIANWLYGVAYRCALKIRTANLRRCSSDSMLGELPDVRQSAPAESADLRALLDRALAKLPEKYRTLIVLCDLEGRKRALVARQLKLAEGTVSSRLAAARRMLARKLGRRGLAISGGALAAALAQAVAQAAVPRVVFESVCAAASQVAAGKSVASLGVAAQIASTYTGVMKAMLLAKLKLPLLFVAAGLFCTALGAFLPRALTASRASSHPMPPILALVQVQTPQPPSLATRVSDIADAMAKIAGRLGNAQGGPETQKQQKQVIDNLAGVVDDLEKKAKDGKPDAKAQTVLAELKLIHAMQRRVNTRTESLAAKYQPGDGESPADPELQREIQVLSERQTQVGNVTGKLAKNMD